MKGKITGKKLEEIGFNSKKVNGVTVYERDPFGIRMDTLLIYNCDPAFTVSGKEYITTMEELNEYWMRVP